MSRDLLSLPSPEMSTSLEHYSQDPLGFMTHCVRKFGDIVPFCFEGELFCLLANPDLITEVLKDRLLFVKAKDLRILQRLLGNGLLVSEGDFWQRQRRLTQPVFHQQRIDSYGAVMVDYTQRRLQTWHENKILDVHDEMMRLTLDIVMKTIFDLDISDRDASHVTHALDEAMNWYVMQQDADLASSDRRYHDAIAALDETIYAAIARRRNSESAGDDLLGMLMQVQDADDGSHMSDKQLRDEVATLMLAGHETTANTLSWTWMLLAQHPKVREKLTQELNALLKGRSCAIADLSRLSYTHKIIKEAMRLYPPVTDLSREATRDCTIGGYSIPKGCTLIMSQWVMHRDPRYFTAPERFDPDRWDDLEKQLPRGVYFPFGDGARICIGKSFALMEAVLILVTIAQKFQLELVSERDIALQPSITLRPKHGIQVVVKKA
jgi:cytochrome P450